MIENALNKACTTFCTHLSDAKSPMTSSDASGDPLLGVETPRSLDRIPWASKRNGVAALDQRDLAPDPQMPRGQDY
jgi:hypothetical protein